jgi:hypothetical protein
MANYEFGYMYHTSKDNINTIKKGIIQHVGENVI